MRKDHQGGAYDRPPKRIGPIEPAHGFVSASIDRWARRTSAHALLAFN